MSGRPHSEYNALKNLKIVQVPHYIPPWNLCTQRKTPPCVDIIVRKKIKNVFYAFEDPDVRTFKKAKKILNNKGISCKLIKSKDYRKFYKGYYINKKVRHPILLLKSLYLKII